MPDDISFPGVYIEESGGLHPINGVATSVTAFMGRALRGPLGTETDAPVALKSFAEYEQTFGGLSHDSPMSYAVQDFFLNGGSEAVINRIHAGGESDNGAGASLQARDYLDALASFDKVDLINLLCIPADSLQPDANAADVAPEVWEAAADYCVKRRAMLIVDSPMSWTIDARNGNFGRAFQSLAALRIASDAARNAAVYFPRVLKADALSGNAPLVFPPCGLIAGVMARTDAAFGVWKAPAGLDAILNHIIDLDFKMTDEQNGVLNPLGINCLRVFPTTGPVIWGARTMRGADELADDFKYIPVRRLALYIEESVYRGTRWDIFEPNAEPLWAKIRLSVNAFMQDLFRQGALQGSSPGDAYFVRCDSTTITQSDIDQGILNVEIGFAPIKPAEYIIIRIQQLFAQAA